MKRRKYIPGLCSVLVCSMLATVALPIWADEVTTPIAEQDGIQTDTDTSQQALNINITANYYTTETEGEYKITFTTLSDIPAFKELGFKVGLTEAKVDRASFESGVLTGRTPEVLRYDNYAVYKLLAETAQGINAKNPFGTLEIFDGSVPTAENLVFSDFYLIDADGKTISVTPVITLQAGPIIPELSKKEQGVYDLIVALPQPNAISFYKEDTSLADVSALLTELNTVKISFDALTSTEKQNVNKVLEYHNYTSTILESLDTVLIAMEQTKGLIEIAYAAKDVTEENILEYQFLLDVYTLKKAEIDTSALSVNTVATEELVSVDTAIENLKSTLKAKITSSDFEDKTYACGDQLDVIHLLSSHVYYTDYLRSLEMQIAAVRKDIEDNYSGRDESKQNLLTYLNTYESNVQLIQNGIDDFPVMICEDIMRGNPYEVTFKRQKALDDSMEVSVRVVVTNANGKQLADREASFPSGDTKLTISFTSSKQTYPKDEMVTITAYYILDKSSFFLDEQEVNCINTRNNISGIGNVNGTGTGIGFGSGSASSSNTSTDSSESAGSSSGGTIFPSEETIEPNNNTSSTTIFTDIENYDWAKDAIEGLYYAGIVNGMEEGIYNPAGVVTREQFAKMVVQLFGVATGNTQTNFVDVKADAWYAPYITAALQAGYIQGQSNEYFGIGESIMRQDMATILYRALGDQNSKAVLSFSDVDSIAPYAEDAIAELVGLDILNGYKDGRFLPRGTATRAEAAKAIWGIYQILN